MRSINMPCDCSCGCNTMVSLSPCQRGGKIWCAPCAREHMTEEEKQPHPAFKAAIEAGLIRRADPPGLMKEDVRYVPPMPKDWLPDELRLP